MEMSKSTRGFRPVAFQIWNSRTEMAAEAIFTNGCRRELGLFSVTLFMRWGSDTEPYIHAARLRASTAAVGV